MPHISKKKLRKDVLIQISDRFMQAAVDLKNKKSSSSYFRELLTPTEQVMLAKRLAAVIMLIENISTYRISNTLKLSPSTVSRLRLWLDRGDFSYIKSIIRKKKNRDEFWSDIEKLLSGGMPPIVGRGRWRFLYENDRN
jgi:uncharacterized protein YerC